MTRLVQTFWMFEIVKQLLDFVNYRRGPVITAPLRSRTICLRPKRRSNSDCGRAASALWPPIDA